MQPVKSVLIVGGGTAGWLAAGTIAARHQGRIKAGTFSVTLVESPSVPIIGVGEGTWPTMRETLAEIGIGEAEFLQACTASFKQGSRFDGWRTGEAGDSYVHPFTPPPPVRDPRQLLAAWNKASGTSFAALFTAQDGVAAAALAPRQRSMPPYAGALNYAYHLDAARFAALLRRHAVQRLGVIHHADRINSVERAADGDLAAILTASGKRIDGDFFIDCTGHSALLIQEHCGSQWIDRSHQLFNDRALAIQVPVQPGSAIASLTIATAHRAGWIWDIGLPGRRGIGCVYASAFMSDSEAEQVLSHYLSGNALDVGSAQPRRLAFPTGHRARFWERNCLAVGLSAGFVEPLEASAIVLIELSLRTLIENFPLSRDAMTVAARMFNGQFSTRWERIVEFLKLHYVLSKRSEPYWRAHRDENSFPDRLAGLLTLWRQQPPSSFELPLSDEIFPAPSYQYVYYGMGGEIAPTVGEPAPSLVAQLDQLAHRRRSLLASLPTNRTYLDCLSDAGDGLQEQA